MAAGAFGVKIQYLDVKSLKDIEAAFQTAGKGRADAVLPLTSQISTSERKRLAELAVKTRPR